MKTQTLDCRLCGESKFELTFDSKLRDGGAKSGSTEGFSIYKCHACSMETLCPIPENLSEFYESQEYREKYDYDFSPSNIHKTYDHEQNERLKRIGINNLRDKVVADFGCSAGVFLDAVRGVAKETIAIEPASIYEKYLNSSGHTYFPYPQDAINKGIDADIAVSFDVIEHLEDPCGFLQEIYSILKPGGHLFLSMPSSHDFLRTVSRETFEPFFYQTAHLNYFYSESVEYLFAQTKFENVIIDYLHKYNLDNLIQWVKHGKPGSTSLRQNLDRSFDTIYKSELERLGISSHFFITARKPLEKELL